MDELTETLAAVQHDIWAHWMRYMFTQGSMQPDGTWVMPAEKVLRWSRQMESRYADLSDREQVSDRDQAEKVIAVLFRADLAL